ncbi:MAG TPA: efflux RND transporter periplasmic adaptor subunit [Vicinamibacteria bacterium]|nr:efflux RND transporter periplasmic adaptor subunit [Vicinamibacteria bacterium]
MRRTGESALPEAAVASAAVPEPEAPQAPVSEPRAEVSPSRGRVRPARRRWPIVAAVLVLAGAGYFYWRTRSAEGAPQYRFSTIERGDIEYLVSSTGTLEPLTKVAVGTQVSGIISEILVDFNDRVEKGQVVARIDPTLLESAVRDARANLARNLAQLQQLESEYSRIERLFTEGLVSQTEYDTARYALAVGRETVSSSEIALARTEQNLAYATIYAPVSGTVIERNVDVGQTVAASFSAPQLFLIAADLRRMQILATVDESDIGRIRKDQSVRFRVSAHPDRTFEGKVRQVRLQSTLVENVVNYTVVIDVDNHEGLLLPGMTATVDFFVETATNVLKIQNSALRFRPTAEMLTGLRESGGRPARTQNGGDGARLWIRGADGKLSMVRVTTGLTDGQWTEISGEGIEEGMEAVAGVITEQTPATSNPFAGPQPQRRFGPRGF